IVVFKTPGANANGVKELTVAALMLASRDIVGGVRWASTLTEDVAKAVEKGKSRFAGQEIEGKTLGVIGLGAIGGLVANAAKSLGMNVIGCDPYLTIDGAWHLSRAVQKAATYDEIFEKADYITLHVPATPQTKNMINAEAIAKMKDGVRIINLARADLVNAADLKAALAAGKVASYVTDFPTEETVGVEGIVAIPHLGASTEESEENCAVMAAQELIDYLEHGNIKNSVNYPNLQLAHTAAHRVLVLHKNIPNMIACVTGLLAEQNINIENMVNASKGDYAATVIETNSPVDATLLAKFSGIDGVIRVIKIA
ncbi:MAG: 3-phosphoglycerate dehydrogenase, partial [Clostridia bacterium]|nr:3-phosphoglycerate dehydrogenase [Clostridia bacterium]